MICHGDLRCLLAGLLLRLAEQSEVVVQACLEHHSDQWRGVGDPVQGKRAWLFTAPAASDDVA